MKAFMMTGYGGPEKSGLQEIDRPRPGPDELLIKVHAAGLNPVDYKIRGGDLKAIQRYKLPAVMGNEVSGIVEAAGARVTQFAPGDRVFARMPKDRMGAFAEYAVVPQDLLARVPDRLDLVTAAGVPLAGLTALQALRDEIGLGPGSRVFISAGAGGVGTFAIQIAKWLGAEVTTTASPRGRELVERLGADHVIDYTQEQFQDRLSDMDGALDLLGGAALEASFGVVRPGGKVVSVSGLPEPDTARKDLGFGPMMTGVFWFISRKLRQQARKHGVRYRFLFMHPSGPELAELAALIEAGRLSPVVDRVFPFAEMSEAMAYLESGRAKGKVIVRMDAA
ncbi:NADP-dependent oxidoreductase [Paracoccus sediminicola]|uniref:NADP-dependent oxidoreductase n=1 Tax=Paracoccus sediminicola TaxID=3017783 RepID=UPI0022F005B7|nr:NADP-dependent oxidoreductase [Paracoccus sediminicola]WBU57423.1 NADP-dependent oxidoreductase [Paracoccus sediminicola]